jgi:hypothetical protein
MPPSSKKRSAAELAGDDYDRLIEENGRLTEEIEQLKHDNKTLRAKLAGYEEEESDEDEEDDESLCDGSPWSTKYHLLKQYKQQHGDCKVPRSKDLGRWVDGNRTAYKGKKLSQERIDKLDKIGFYWGKGYPEPRTWDDNFRELQEYHSTFGHCNVPVDSNPSLQTPLAKWMLEQRKQGKRLRKQKPSNMTMDQYKRLENLGFKWKAGPRGA